MKSKEEIKPKPPAELNTLDLLELVCQLHSRALQFPVREMHIAYVEARNELQKRLQPSPERFKMPNDKQIIGLAILYNDGKIEKKKLMDMVALCQFTLDRLYENGDILIPSSKEQK